jgi:signal transduction histidine kinase/DNA-binding response OmpR family regulator/serine phosphatase RsbU (regulator of sigma subunit)
VTRAAGDGKELTQSLAAVGPVAEDLLAVDWDSTPLGPPGQWPQSLRSVIETLLSSRFSMWMAWGPELTFFCNDAYRRDTLGKKYPWALGRRADEVWAEIWHDIGPRIEQVMQTGEATWDEALMLFLERSGYVEETYHTFSYSPLRDDAGEIAGMLCVVSEETERVIALRRMETLQALGSHLTSQLDEEAVLRLATRDLAASSSSIVFALVYLFDDDSDDARLAAAIGIEHDHLAAPPLISATDENPLWPASELAAGRPILVETRKGRFGDLPTGRWRDPPEYAYLVPLRQQGQARPRPWGFLVAGLNRYRVFDASYRSFIDLVAGQLAAALASARAYETERRRAEELAELDRAKTQFFTNVSHELRTPLTLLLGPAEDALAEADAAERLAPAQRLRLEVIERNARRLLHLVNNLLDFSRIEAGRLQASFEEVDLARHTGELASMFSSAVERAGLRLEVDLEPVGEAIYVDREMWAKIVLNLLSNAVKFTERGTISVSLRRRDALVELAVTDTGIGIATEDQQRLFARFERLDSTWARAYEGSGIGLALVAELVALHGGEVGIESTPGAGSTFTVRIPVGRGHLPGDQVDLLPVATESPAATEQVEGFVSAVMRWLDASRATSATPGEGFTFPQERNGDRSRRPTVLVADDNADMRSYIARLLEPSYDVVVAGDGATALELARAEPPDLVLTDVMMPKLDGFGLIRELRQDPSTVGVPVIVLSARAGEDGIVEGLEAGADDYVVKPFSAKELVARVRSTIELDRARRTRDELARSQALLDQAQRLAHLGSWEVDLESGAVVASDETLRILQLTGPELEQVGFVEAVSRGSEAAERERVEEAVRAAVETTEPIDFEVTLRLPDGSTRWVHALGEAVSAGDGQSLKLRGSLQDVTVAREAEVRLREAAAERVATAREHRIADELQRSLLPPRTFDPEHLDVATYYRAGVEGTQVGGDWYDVIDLGAGRTALVIGDVMGRGVRAAAIMGQLRSAIRAYARLDLPPADVLELCDTLVRDLRGDQIVTCIYATYDPADCSVTYARAGHLPPVLLRPGEAPRPLTSGGGAPLGAGPLSLVTERIDLVPGAAVALYTDGLIERRSRGIEEGMATLGRELATAAAAAVPIAEVPERLVAALLDEEPDDDVALLVARVPIGVERPAAGSPVGESPATEAPLAESTVAEAPRTASFEVSYHTSAARTARAEVGPLLEAWDIRRELVGDVTLVVSELVTNAVLHGLPPVRLQLCKLSRQLVVEVSDGGMLFSRRRPASRDDEHGRGLQVVAAVSDEWGQRPTAGGKSVWCAFDLVPGAHVGPSARG